MFTNVSSVGTKLDKISVQRKIIVTCSAAAILFFIKNPIVMFSIFATLLLIYFIVGGLKFLGLGIYQLKVTVPFVIILAFWHLYLDQLDRGMALIFRLISAFLIANLFLLTSKIHDIILAIQKYSVYLKILGINSHAVSITIGLFIRSIPILKQRAKNLMLAQSARSTKRSFWRISVPLAISILDDADHVSEALRARGGIRKKEN
ncbi:MAG: energy-coupling factor transporter transmembrane component T [Paracoccaceae bacterium]|nr:energy-coupling factor transporter transmembrane component T [Paracoccaceae bacterium]